MITMSAGGISTNCGRSHNYKKQGRQPQNDISCCQASRLQCTYCLLFQFSNITEVYDLLIDSGHALRSDRGNVEL